MIKELKELLKKEAKENGNLEAFDFIERATTLQHLGYSFTDAIKKLKEAGLTIVLTEEEKTKGLTKLKMLIKQ